jgi:hypothetical protein
MIGGVPVASGSSFTTPALSATTIYYVESIVYGDTSISRLAVTVTVNSVPAQPTISQSGNTLTSSSATGNQWFRNGVLIPGATNQSYVVTSDGYYTVQVTTNGCVSVLSSEYFMNVTQLDESILSNQVRVVPNPNAGLFTVNFSTSQSTERFIVEVINTLGQVILTDNVNGFTGNYSNTFDLSSEPDGAYIINIYTDNETFQKQLLKE